MDCTQFEFANRKNIHSIRLHQPGIPNLLYIQDNEVPSKIFFLASTSNVLFLSFPFYRVAFMHALQFHVDCDELECVSIRVYAWFSTFDIFICVCVFVLADFHAKI